jgi:hypothetical protein
MSAMTRRSRFAALMVGLAAVVFLAASALVLAAPQVRGSGKLVLEQPRQVGPFHTVNVEQGIQVEARRGPSPAVTVTAEDNILPLIETVVQDGVLAVRMKSGASVNTTVPMRVRVVSPGLSAVSAQSGARLQGEGSAKDRFSARASSGASVAVSGIEAPDVKVAATAGSKIVVSGRGRKLELAVSAGSDVDAAGLHVEEVSVSGSAGAHAEVQASRVVTGSLSAGAHLVVGGPARREVHVSSGAAVTGR